MATILEIWHDHHRGVADTVRKLELAGTESLGALLQVLKTDLYGHPSFGNDNQTPTLDEREVDGVLNDAVPAQQLLAELDALDAAAESWRNSLQNVREAIIRRFDDEQADAAFVVRASGSYRRDMRMALCEADDEHWYL